MPSKFADSWGRGYPQLLTYMKLAGVTIGLLINFNNTQLKDGIKRFVL